MLEDVNQTLLAAANQKLPDRLAQIPELANYACFAVDGHWHKGATHDPRHDGKKMAVGHFYSLNLRSHALGHLAVGEGLHEHDMQVSVLCQFSLLTLEWWIALALSATTSFAD